MVRVRRSASQDERLETQTTAHERVWEVIREFMQVLDDVPGWQEWRRQKISHTLNYHDPYPVSPSHEMVSEFRFSEDIEKQHAVIMAFLALADGVESLKECEYYFRRYPFRGLPVGRHRHIVNICEMYFSRFYEIRERIRNVLNAVNAVIAPEKLDVGRFLKTFDKVFDQEIKARHSVHHRERFDDMATNRIFLTEILASSPNRDAPDKRVHLSAYRRLANEWAQRVRRRGKLMDEFLEAVANAVTENCKFAFREKV